MHCRTMEQISDYVTLEFFKVVIKIIILLQLLLQMFATTTVLEDITPWSILKVMK